MRTTDWRHLAALFIFLACLWFLPAEEAVVPHVKVGAFDSFPSLFQDGNGEIRGYVVDVLTEFGRKQGIQFDFVYGTFSQSMDLLKNGQLDLLPLLAKNTEREAVLEFGQQYLMIVWGELYVAETSPIDSIAQVQGTRIGIVKNDINARAFADLINQFGLSCQFVEFPDYSAIFDDIDKGRVDGGITNVFYGSSSQKKHSVRASGIAFNPYRQYFAVAKGKNGELLAQLDRALLDWRADNQSILYTARLRWASGTTEYLNVVPPIVVQIVVGLGLAIVISTAFIILLRLQVKARTRVLNQSLREKETLLGELYHRTKNTLQVIQGLLALQAAEYPDNPQVSQLVEITRQRIEAISLVHQSLYHSRDLSNIPVQEYVESLCSKILGAYTAINQQIQIAFAISTTYYLIDTMVPIGLMLNELITNSLKHAFPNSRSGLITITIGTDQEGSDYFHYSDDGIGFAADFDPRNVTTFGISLIISLAEDQLQGSVRFESVAGFQCHTTFRRGLFAPRV